MRLQNAILRIRLHAVWPEKLYMLTYGGKWGAKTEKRNTIFGQNDSITQFGSRKWDRLFGNE